MDAQTMLRTAVILLAVTALGGLLMAGMRFSGRPHPPTLITMVHGLLAASGLTLVLYVAFTAGLPGSGWIGLLLLLAAVLGGLVLNLRYHWERLELPVWLILVHAAAAAIGLVVLALAVWNKGG
ncbi:MAG TPA: hypothetical protein VFV11_10315 [Solimonas sp.]|nr:hypothetical protein [Solimonas sp.]